MFSPRYNCTTGQLGEVAGIQPRITADRGRRGRRNLYVPQPGDVYATAAVVLDRISETFPVAQSTRGQPRSICLR